MDECIEWQVNYGYQRFHKFIIKIKKKHQKMPFSLSSIHDQNTIFIQISHIVKSHTHKSIFGSTQTINQFIQCIYDECIEWQVNYGYQKCHEFLFQIQNKHQNLPFSLSSIHDQNTIFIQISHIAKSIHTNPYLEAHKP